MENIFSENNSTNDESNHAVSGPDSASNPDSEPDSDSDLEFDNTAGDEDGDTDDVEIRLDELGEDGENNNEDATSEMTEVDVQIGQKSVLK